MWITVTSKKHNNKRIELNVKNLNIKLDDVAVLKSIRLTNLDFDEDLDWDLSEEDTLPRFRTKRNAVNVNESATSDGNDENNSAELEDSINATTVTIDKAKYYHHPVFPSDEFVIIKILDLEFDESNEKMIIYLGTEMKKDIYYIVKVNFTGNMTNDKGLYFTHYKDGEGDHKYMECQRMYSLMYHNLRLQVHSCHDPGTK